MTPATRCGPAELLALWEVYETPAEARASLDGVGKTMAESLVGRQLSRSANGALRAPHEVRDQRMVKRGAGRLIPFLGAPISAMQNGRVHQRAGQGRPCLLRRRDQVET